MKKSLAIVVGTVVLLAAGMPLAQDAKAPASNPNATATQSGSSMNMGSQMGQMDEHMKKMKALHEKMTSATTPEERQKVMDEQRQEMQAGMGMMNQMMQGGGMMGDMGGGMMGQKGKPADANRADADDAEAHGHDADDDADDDGPAGDDGRPKGPRRRAQEVASGDAHGCNDHPRE